MKPKFVKINSSRGYGNDMWLVIARTDGMYPELTLEKPVSKERIKIYLAHTYEDFDTRLHTLRYIQERASSIIGSNDNRPKKKKRKHR